MLYAVKHSLAVIASDFLLHPMQAHTESITRSPACRSPSQTAKLKKSPIAPIIIRVYYFL
jgi:hypothetical protein